jgi:hypothetical protein
VRLASMRCRFIESRMNISSRVEAGALFHFGLLKQLPPKHAPTFWRTPALSRGWEWVRERLCPLLCCAGASRRLSVITPLGSFYLNAVLFRLLLTVCCWSVGAANTGIRAAIRAWSNAYFVFVLSLVSHSSHGSAWGTRRFYVARRFA